MMGVEYVPGNSQLAQTVYVVRERGPLKRDRARDERDEQ